MKKFPTLLSSLALSAAVTLTAIPFPAAAAEIPTEETETLEFFEEEITEESVVETLSDLPEEPVTEEAAPSEPVVTVPETEETTENSTDESQTEEETPEEETTQAVETTQEPEIETAAETETTTETKEETPEERTPADNEAEEEFVLEGTLTFDAGDTDNASLFDQYFAARAAGGRQALYASDYGTQYFSSLGDDGKYSLAVYQALKEAILKAAENGGSTKFDVTEGIDAIVYTDKNYKTEMSDAEKKAVQEELKNHFDSQAILRCLLLDCPYELYWFNKSSGGMSLSYRIGYTSKYSKYVKVTKVTASFAVTKAYQAADYDTKNPAMTTNVTKVKTAIANAKKIVDENKDLSDYVKLEAYMKTICDLTDYNKDAVSDNGYGDAWQLIWVFDGDASTKVRCEGYAKAFKYLCDLSTWNADFECYLADGVLTAPTLTQGTHMWNIVAWDGDTYMVDVTNCDNNTAAQNGGLFMVSNSGDAKSYSFVIGKNVYTYTYADLSLNILSEDIRRLVSRPVIYWSNGEEIIYASKYDIGKYPVYKGPSPSREDEQYTYKFMRWNPTLAYVTESTTYTAVYSKIEKPADYTAVNEAVAKANALDPEDYKDFTAVKAALKAVHRNYRISRQSDVDAMAKEIEEALADLERVLPFNDIKMSTELGKAVKYAYENNITSGTSKTSFTPSQPVTRAQMTTFLYRLAGSPRVNVYTGFTDMPSNMAYVGPISWAVEKKITAGTSATTFSPSNSCTRGQMMTFLYRLAGSPEITSTSPFTDVKATSPYAKAIAWCYENGIAKGTSATTFTPNQACTRGQAVIFIYRFMQNGLSVDL